MRWSVCSADAPHSLKSSRGSGMRPTTGADLDRTASAVDKTRFWSFADHVLTVDEGDNVLSAGTARQMLRVLLAEALERIGIHLLHPFRVVSPVSPILLPHIQRQHLRERREGEQHSIASEHPKPGPDPSGGFLKPFVDVNDEYHTGSSQDSLQLWHHSRKLKMMEYGKRDYNVHALSI